jgi:hypothetical protein
MSKNRMTKEPDKATPGREGGLFACGCIGVFFVIMSLMLAMTFDVSPSLRDLFNLGKLTFGRAVRTGIIVLWIGGMAAFLCTMIDSVLEHRRGRGLSKIEGALLLSFWGTTACTIMYFKK